MSAEPQRRGVVIVLSGPLFDRDPAMHRVLQQLEEKAHPDRVQVVDLGAALDAYEPRYPGDFAMASELLQCAPEPRRSDRWEVNPLAGEHWGRSGKRRGRTR